MVFVNNMEKAAYTPVPGTLGDVGQRTKKSIVDSSKNIHLMTRKELIRDTSFAQYKKGEIVAIAQRYSDMYIGLLYDWETYKRNLPAGMSVADFRKEFEGERGWNNKMFVKPKYMPRRIEITDVRTQCLQEITDDECLLEGIEKEERTDGGYNYIFFDAKRELYIRERTPRDAYARLIDALSGKGTWESNPYVFAYDFDLV